MFLPSVTNRCAENTPGHVEVGLCVGNVIPIRSGGRREQALKENRGYSVRKRLPREVADASSLEVPKASLDGALDNLVSWKASLPMAGGWN